MPRSSGLLAAVDYARSRGAVVVAAAGNGDDWQGVYPAAYGPVVSVGAADPATGARYAYSAFGPFLDITAPGLMVTAELGGLSAPFSGTSAATPVVSGSLGLLFSLHPELSVADALSALAATAQDAGVPGLRRRLRRGRGRRECSRQERRSARPRATCTLPPSTHGAGFPRPIVFVSSCGGSFDVYSMLQDGRDVRRLTTSATIDRHPALSVRARRIAFLRGDFTHDDLYVMRSDGSGVRRLTHFEGGVEAPAWSPDGSTVAFSAYDREGFESKGSDIYTIRPDGSHLRRITDLGVATDPAWSPDGRRIVFARIKYGDLWVMTANGKSFRQLTRPPRGIVDVTPAWSPDGKRIAFARRSNSAGDVFGGRRQRKARAAAHDGRRRLQVARLDAERQENPVLGAATTGIPTSSRSPRTAAIFGRCSQTPASEVEVGSSSVR